MAFKLDSAEGRLQTADSRSLFSGLENTSSLHFVLTGVLNLHFLSTSIAIIYYFFHHMCRT